MFTAVKGGEAQLDGRHITAGDEPITPFTSVGLDSHFDGGPPPWLCNIISQCRFRNFGTTALHLAYVAKGGLVAALMCTPKLWDIAAGTLIAQEAGAVVTDWSGGKIFPIDLDGYEGQTFRVVAANKKTHPGLLEVIRKE
jgi:myo-inositol-1(or 4)-monophosphatase